MPHRHLRAVTRRRARTPRPKGDKIRSSRAVGAAEKTAALENVAENNARNLAKGGSGNKSLSPREPAQPNEEERSGADDGAAAHR